MFEDNKDHDNLELRGREAVKKMRMDARERVKGDQRILGDTEFVVDVLKEAKE